jgi:hypothetical protein
MGQDVIAARGELREIVGNVYAVLSKPWQFTISRYTSNRLGRASGP